MEQLRLVGVHDDGEHLIVETPDSRRYVLRIDSQVRQAVQHARKKSPSGGVGGARFGPRDIQARFRAGASVDDIVAECGWEPERVRRYEWPILAERAHIVREACKVKISGTSPSHDGYRSVFEGEPRSLEDVVRRAAQNSGVDVDSLDWDAWQREDQLWTVHLSFAVSDAARAPVDVPGPAEWTYNPANQTVRPVNDWARTLIEEPREAGPLGIPAPAPGRALPEDARTEGAELQRQDSREAEELLDVLQARRGRRLGADVDNDDRLAEILGRGMGQVTTRPRPIGAPEDSELFNRPIQPAAGRTTEDQAPDADEDIEVVSAPTETTDHGEFPESTATAQPVDMAEDRSHTATLTPPYSNAQEAPVTAAPAPTEAAESTDAAAPGDPSTTSPTQDAPDSDTGTEKPGGAHPAQPQGPRGRTGKAKRSAVPSWHDIVFGSNPS